MEFDSLENLKEHDELMINGNACLVRKIFDSKGSFEVLLSDETGQYYLLQKISSSPLALWKCEADVRDSSFAEDDVVEIVSISMA